jgi:RNA 3'-terminal phosphate cyclase
VLRNAAAYACILQQTLEITNIRAGRKTPGLQAQHGACFVLRIVSVSFEAAVMRVRVRVRSRLLSRVSCQTDCRIY